MVTILSIGALLYLGLVGALYLLQRSMIYFPTPQSSRPGQGSWMLSVDGAEVEIISSERPGAKALLYFGGNAEDVSLARPQLERVFPEQSLYLMHYRGYGRSTGKPSERALVADAQALYDFAVERHPQVWVMGRSLGSGVAVQLAASREVERLVLVTPYDSILRVAQRQFPFVPVGWILKDKFESWRYAARLRVPTLLVVAERDEVIGRERSLGLLEAFQPGVAEMVVVEGAGHNTVSEETGYEGVLERFGGPLD